MRGITNGQYFLYFSYILEVISVFSGKVFSKSNNALKGFSWVYVLGIMICLFKYKKYRSSPQKIYASPTSSHKAIVSLVLIGLCLASSVRAEEIRTGTALYRSGDPVVFVLNDKTWRGVRYVYKAKRGYVVLVVPPVGGKWFFPIVEIDGGRVMGNFSYSRVGQDYSEHAYEAIAQ